jgi:hypothetical protein
MVSASTEALRHRALEIVERPFADAGIGIRRDVGADKIAERGFQDDAASEGLACRRRMACRAIAEYRKIAAAFDLREGGVAW